jgi:pyruvate/2-oxoglutarate dehydrogenase complex dihydrolipoamide dehydrogenase (E3) component
MTTPAAAAARSETDDAVLLGSGEAGKCLAWTLAKQGRRTAVIAARTVGGYCPNIACLPSKNIIHSATTMAEGQNLLFASALHPPTTEPSPDLRR